MAKRSRLLLLGFLALSLTAAGAAALVVPVEQPSAVDDLRRLEAAGEKARARSGAIVTNLRRLARNLEGGAGLPEASSQIRGLTERQRRSLDDLAALLRDQLAAVDETAAALESTRATTSGLARLSGRQVRIVARAAAALERLERLAASAGATSADIAWAARYGARLAEDSARRFGTGP